MLRILINSLKITVYHLENKLNIVKIYVKIDIFSKLYYIFQI